MHLQLIPAKPEYAEAFFRWRSESATVRYNPLANIDLETCRESLRNVASNLEEVWTRPNFRWFIEREHKLVGTVALSNINRMMLTAEIGYIIGEDFFGQGIGTRAVTQFVEKIFQETELRKLFALVHESNIASCKLLERLGFQKEGVLRDHYLVNNLPTNEVFYGLLRREWPAR